MANRVNTLSELYRQIERTGKLLVVQHARRVALENGYQQYEGEKCKHGHSGIRYAKNAICVACSSNKAKVSKLKQAISAHPAERCD